MTSQQAEYWEEDLINFTDIDPQLLNRHFLRENIFKKDSMFIYY